MADFSLEKLVAHFAQSNKAEGKAEKTVFWYSQMLEEHLKFLAADGKTTILAMLNPESVRDFIVAQQEKGLSPFTIAARVRALKAFSSWLEREGFTPDNVLRTVKLPKTPQKIIEVLNLEEINRLVSLQNTRTALGSRNVALLTTLLDCGIRINEICGLSVENVHIDQGYIKVLGKGNKERVVPLGTLAQKIISRYIFHFRPEPMSPADDCLFLTLAGERLTDNAVRLLLKRWGKKAGVPRLHAHLCRHTYATSFLNHRCGDVFRLQQILGHSTLEMVRHYVHYASSQDMIQGCVSSPVDRMGIKKLKGYRTEHLIPSNKH